MDNLFRLLSVVQFAFSFIIGIYFWKRLRKERGNEKAVVGKSRREERKLKKKRRISLSNPLSEKTRPQDFKDIIGQQEGIAVLKAALCGPNPQHVIIYGPPGVGKTAAARLVLEAAKKNPGSPFKHNASFVEVDATIARFDERSIADPLIGSVHDPIYQGAGSMGAAGIPQPKPGAVTRAHGGILFIDEIGELHPIQMNKLLKVLEDRKVFLDSAYYSEDNKKIPQYIHEIFQKGLPADFRLVGATTKQPQQIPPAIRSRCLEIFFSELNSNHIAEIARRALDKIYFDINEGALELIKKYAANGRETVNMIQLSGGMAQKEKRKKILARDVKQVINSGQYNPRREKKISDIPQIGVVHGLAVKGPRSGLLLEIETSAIPVKEGTGNINITGVIEEEEMEGPGHTVRRRSLVKESAENALTVLRRMTKIEVDKFDIHINFPGGIPVDGPSAGLSIAVALYSALSGKPVANKLAMTGEVTIRGLIKPIGGTVAKIEAARDAGASCVLIPEENFHNLHQDFTEIEVKPIKTLKEAINLATEIEEEEKQNLITTKSLMTVSSSG
ncbi:MAG: ATP-dependent protease LonB [Halanaerobiaceae bacterium]